MSNPAWWLQKALIAHQSMLSAAADAGLSLQDVAVGVTGGVEANPDYVISAKDTDTGNAVANQAGAGLDDTGFATYRDGIIVEL